MIDMVCHFVKPSLITSGEVFVVSEVSEVLNVLRFGGWRFFLVFEVFSFFTSLPASSPRARQEMFVEELHMTTGP